jgi:protease-4
MKVNYLINEIAKGQWAMSIDSLSFWIPQAHRLLKGKEINFAVNAKRLVDFYDENNNQLKADADGLVNVPKNSVAVVNMIGPIISYGDWCTFGADEIVSQLRKLDADDNIKSIIVYMDGPGGSVGAVAPFLDFGAERNSNKPLGVVYETCASAHLYIAYGLRPNFVWASNNISAVIGSLGVVFSYLDDTKYMKENGFEIVEIYPDESKDKNLPFRLAREGKFDLIKKEMLSPLAIRFQEDVVRLNPELKKDVPGVITGASYYAAQAIEYGFAQRVGNLSQAIEYIQVLSETNHYK